MKILHLINSMIVGGAETLLKDLIIGIHNHYPEFEQHLITLYGGGKMLDSTNNFIKYKDLGVNHFNFLLKSIELKKYIKDNKIDVVHAHLYDAMILSRLAASKNVKLIYTYHSGLHNKCSNDYSLNRLLLDKLTYKKSHIAIFVSDSVKKDILNGVNINGNSFVVDNFTSNKFSYQYKNSNKQELKIVSVGNLKTVKNHSFSIEILSKIIKYPINLDIYGDGELFSELKKHIKSNGAKVNIFTNVNIDSELLAKYDLFLMSSIQEGMSVALIEAMTTGLPSCLSNIPSFKETAGQSAFFFNLNDLSDAVSKILFIYENKDCLINMSLEAKKRSTNFSFETHIKKIVGIYKI
jgi:glycosyltransferase involved in cell wall biosynthesis